MDFDYLILGNSAAGVSAAEAIRACRPQETIAIASPEPHPAYGRPLISYLLEGKTSLDRIGYKDPAFYDRMRIATLLGEGYEAVSIDAEGHRVAFSNGKSVGYGRCLIATGSIPFTPPIDGLDQAANATTPSKRSSSRRTRARRQVPQAGRAAPSSSERGSSG